MRCTFGFFGIGLSCLLLPQSPAFAQTGQACELKSAARTVANARKGKRKKPELMQETSQGTSDFVELKKAAK